MPYETTWEKRGAYTRWYGNCTTSELLNMQENAQSHPRFDEVSYSIHDFSACERFEGSSSDIQFSAAIANAASQSNAHINIAVVAPKEDVLEFLNVYIGARLSPYPLRIFSSLEEARQWAK